MFKKTLTEILNTMSQRSNDYFKTSFNVYFIGKPQVGKSTFVNKLFKTKKIEDNILITSLSILNLTT
jgi:ribosome biogenesis GTPase A